MDIQDNLCAHQLRHQRAEDTEVRDIMIMDDIVTVADMKSGNLDKGFEEKDKVIFEIGRRPGFLEIPGADIVKPYALECCHLGFPGIPDPDHVHRIPPFDQGQGVTVKPPVELEMGETQHADFHKDLSGEHLEAGTGLDPMRGATAGIPIRNFAG
jgi:hypothetical protein